MPDEQFDPSLELWLGGRLLTKNVSLESEVAMKICVSMSLFFFLSLGLGLFSSFADAAERAAESRQTLLLGQAVYEANCAVCHGVEGDGNGAMAHMFRIQPRDFRRGIFKFRSTPTGSLPTDDDIVKTIANGVRWTAMIARPDLTERERRAVVQYLKAFSPRFANESPEKSVVVAPVPKRSEELVTGGKRLYREIGCPSCHGDEGKGDGPSAPGMKDDWGSPTWPSDLTWRPLKRGSDIRETYLTLVTGLSGTPMPSYASALNVQQTWALVYYLESLVPPDRRLSPDRILGEEQAGWMALRMGGMMGRGMMGPGMMRRMPSR